MNNNTVLIVDDVKLNIDLLTDILNENYNIMAAVSGENAIRLLDRKKPDIVLLDLSMPGIDGFGVLQYMKERKELAGIPVIFVTGEHDADMEEKGLSLGAMDYIKKPYNATVVKFKVRNQLELKAYRDNLESLVSERTKELERRTAQLAASKEAIIMGMSLMSEIHDAVTGAHIERIKAFTAILTDKMLELYPDMITVEHARQTVLFSPLHDVGKVAVSDNILKKTGSLTPEEFEEMKSHTVQGAKLLRKTESFLTDDNNLGELRVAMEIAEYHHERFCGGGYPHGLKGEEIPLSARIVTVTDVYDALRSPRPYKKAYSHQEAMEIIISGDGRTSPNHFDPRILNVLRSVQCEFERVFEHA